MFTWGLLGSLVARNDVEPSVYAVTWRGRGEVGQLVPKGVGLGRSPMAARPLRWAWKRWDVPPIEWWTGEVDVVHGTNFVVPPARDAAEVVTVHDLTPMRFPELAHAATLDYEPLIRRAIDRGALVHTPSAFVAGEGGAATARPLGGAGIRGGGGGGGFVPRPKVVPFPVGVGGLGPPAVGGDARRSAGGGHGGRFPSGGARRRRPVGSRRRRRRF